MRVLVTGGAGFIGSHLVGALAARNYQIRVLDNLSTGRSSNVGPGVEFIRGDIRDEACVREAMEGVSAVFHVAALPSVARSWQDPVTSLTVNTQGTAVVVKAAISAGVETLVYSSSSSVYGDQPAARKREDLPPRPISPYGVSKLLGEEIVLAHAWGNRIRAIALRYFNVFGPRQDPHSPYAAVIPLFIRHAIDDTPATVYGDGMQTRDFTYVENVVAANLLALTASASGVAINIACGQERTLIDVVTAIAGLNGHGLRTMAGPAREGDIRHSAADITLAAQAIGYRPIVSFETGLRMTYEALKAH